MYKMHELKTDKEPFQATWNDIKFHEVRINDRKFCVGDTIILQEIEYHSMYGIDDTGYQYEINHKKLVYTGRRIFCVITYISDRPSLGLDANWCVLSIKVLHKQDK